MSGVEQERRVRVLVVEDQSSFSDPLVAALKKSGFEDVDLEMKFDRGLEILQSSEPDVLALDIYAGNPVDGKEEGRRIWETVWQRRFRPVLLMSAGPVDDLKETADGHPLLRFVDKKEPGAIGNVVEGVKELLGEWERVRGVWGGLDGEVARAVQTVLTRLVPLVWKDVTDPADRLLRLGNAVARQLSSELEAEPARSGTALLPWERYVAPPIRGSLLTADVLLERSKDRRNPSAYRVVLTPSCDMTVQDGRSAKVSQVLTAVCVPIERFDNAKRFPTPDKTDFRDGCRDRLSAPHQGGFTAMPSFGGLIPSMAVSYRQLDVLNLTEIDPDGDDPNDKRPYVRVMSIDSPFREQIVWAYLEVACRPGAPDSDWAAWGRAIVDSRKQAATVTVDGKGG